MVQFISISVSSYVSTCKPGFYMYYALVLTSVKAIGFVPLHVAFKKYSCLLLEEAFY